MVKENDTWQFANCHFPISKITTRARPTHLHLSEILTDSRLLMEGWGTSPPTSFSCLCYCPENFLPLEINLLWGGKKKKKYLLCHLSLSFHQISWRRSVGGGARAGAEVIKLWVWGNVRHSQTSLTPRAVICQNELWSRILLITLQGGGAPPSRVTARFSLFSSSVFRLSATNIQKAVREVRRRPTWSFFCFLQKKRWLSLQEIKHNPPIFFFLSTCLSQPGPVWCV